MLNIISILFFLSGFCALLYQVVWIRLAYASFGIITPVLSVIISVFMLGLALGAWIGGKSIESLSKRFNTSGLLFYGIAEIFIGFGAFLVPKSFFFGENILLQLGQIDSGGYLLYSSLFITLSILPWCIFMGFSFPFMMAFIKEIDPKETHSFSFLYYSNVLGAMFGTLATAVVLIEIMGFQNCLLLAGILNFIIGGLSLLIVKAFNYKYVSSSQVLQTKTKSFFADKESFFIVIILFFTGFVSMSLEVIWTRAFTPVLRTRTYSFASLLAVYLFGTWIGSSIYRKKILQNQSISLKLFFMLISIAGLLPICLNDPRFNLGPFGALASIFPFCAILGYYTPALIDRFSKGLPYSAGKIYAINTLGCILGPLAASYIFLPNFGVRFSMIILISPFFIVSLILNYKTIFKKTSSTAAFVSTAILFLISYFFIYSFEDIYISDPNSEVRRDHTATIISTGKDFERNLYVNGIGITHLTPVTKIMAHLPLFSLSYKPEKSCVICLGMGTSYRSLMSWNIKSKAVELVPSVKDALPFYFDDVKKWDPHPNGEIIIDDGRRFLKRTKETFDVITIDPPPPIEVAGSSLLYSVEFLELIKQKLNPKGILHHWFPFGEYQILQAIAGSMRDVFPHIRVFQSVENWGYHFLASKAPINIPEYEIIEKNMPKSAQADLLEWYPNKTLKQIINEILIQEVPLNSLLHQNPKVIITDDKPFNEYFIIRRFFNQLSGKGNKEV